MHNHEGTQGTWLKLVDAAFSMGVSEITLRRKIKSGKIPHEFRDGKYYVFVGNEESQNELPKISTPPSQSTHTFREPSRTSTLSTRYPQSRESGLQNSTEQPKAVSSSLILNKLETRIAHLEHQLSEKDLQIIRLKREFEDQQTLISFLEDQVKDLTAPKENTARSVPTPTSSSFSMPKNQASENSAPDERNEFPYRII